MANVQRTSGYYSDPFGDVFDDLVKGFFVRPLTSEPAQAATQRLKIDVAEDDKSYTVHADLPGVKKDAINVTIEGDQVSISAETREEREAKEGSRVIHTERHYGKVQRVFRLGQEIDQANAQAKFTDGVLELVLPKKAAQNARQLSIQ